MQQKNFTDVDGSIDSGYVDNEIVLVVWFDQNGPDEKACILEQVILYKPNSTSGEGIL